MVKIFRLTIRCESDAFHPQPEDEVARLLRELAFGVEEGFATGTYQTVLDINGNDVGRWRLGEEVVE